MLSRLSCAARACALALVAVAVGLAAGGARAADTAPPNDAFSAPQTIGGVDGSVSGSNANASADWNEPYTPVRGGVSVWYVWTAPRNGTVTFSAAGSGFQPTVSVFEGDAPDRVALWSSGVGSATFDARQNTSYRIDVDGDNGGTGSFMLSWAFAPTGAAANDYFADAQTIEGSTGSTTGSTENATVEAGEPIHSGFCCSNDNEHSIWYRWTSPVTGDAFFTTQGSTFDTVLAAYTGTSVDSLTRQGFAWNDANPWTQWSRLELRVTTGATYYLALDAANGETGAAQLNWRTTERTDDLTLPAVQLTSPAGGARVGGTIALRADASDDEAVDRVEYHIAPNGSGGDWYVGEAYAPPYEVDFDTSVLEPGIYDVFAIAYDASGNGASQTSTFVIPAPAPTLTLPKTVTQNAVSPAGARVKFSVSARDYTGRSLQVTCAPASGSLFPVGTTAVACSTADSYGNRLTKSFSVHVKGAAEQLEDTRASIAALGLRDTVASKLDSELGAAEKQLAAARIDAACSVLVEFRDSVSRLAGKDLTTDQAAMLDADAQRIGAVIGC